MPEPARVQYADYENYARSLSARPAAIEDAGLRAELEALAQALYRYELPVAGIAILTGMIDDVGEAVRHLFGFLREAIVDLAADETAAIAAPTGDAGDEDGTFAPHSDMWIPGLLFNVLELVPNDQGANLLMTLDHALDVVAEAGMPADKIEGLRECVIRAGDDDLFDAFNGLLYDDQPWTPAVKKALMDAAEVHPLGPGQGYLVDDRRWLHGRRALAKDALPHELRHRRLHRLAYNNARLQAERLAKAAGPITQTVSTTASDLFAARARTFADATTEHMKASMFLSIAARDAAEYLARTGSGDDPRIARLHAFADAVRDRTSPDGDPLVREAELLFADLE